MRAFGASLVLVWVAVTSVSAAVIIVDDDAPSDPSPGNPGVGDPLEDGSSEHPYDDIQEAIDLSTNCDEIIVEPGVYDRIDFLGKDIVVRSTNPADPYVVADTIISASSEPYGSGDVVMGSDGTISGFTIRNGTTGVRYADSDRGAFSPTVTHCVITGCYYGIKGYVHYHPESVAPVITNNIITGRLSGVWLDHQSNSGGVHAIIRNNVIAGVQATYGRGIVYRMHKSLPAVTNNIIVDWNVGIELVYTSLIDQRKELITFNDVWNNAVNLREPYNGMYTRPFELPAQQGNISEDPLWQDVAAGDYHLQEGSPCANAGDPDYIAAPDELDMEGDDRILACRVDMGPDESPHHWDCNQTGEADVCEPLSGGDFNADGYVDQLDMQGFVDCLAGPDTFPTTLLGQCGWTCLYAFDSDSDGDIDLSDFGTIQSATEQ